MTTKQPSQSAGQSTSQSTSQSAGQSAELFVHLFHILFVGGLFLYFGITRTNHSKFVLRTLLYLGLFIVLYHVYKVYHYIIHDKSYWVNLIHIFLVGPLLMYIGYYADETPRLYFELLMMLGFASIGYHGYYLFAR
jgi:hypothetical protein